MRTVTTRMLIKHRNTVVRRSAEMDSARTDPFSLSNIALTCFDPNEKRMILI